MAAAALAAASKAAPPEPPKPSPFDGGTVRKLARELAAKAYAAPDTKLPDAIANLDYDAYRSIRFDPAQALWRGTGLPFQAQFFHRGWLYKERVDIFEVADGQARPIVYRPEMFISGGKLQLTQNDTLGFSGFRLHAPINRPDYYDEVCVFLGASYFRAVAKNEGYGLSARGLSIKTGDPGGEEFPAFRSFWLERPQKGTNSIVVHALLDSQSCTAAVRFTIRPGDDTTMDMETALFPRVDLHDAGVGTGTSMFFFDASDRTGIDDWRRAVHDSDGLMMLSGRGEQLWRQLANPRKLQISAFVDTSPRGFGLVQRKRKLRDFEDLEARYDRRPSLWVEPIGDWGDGQVQLIEIPTKDEVHDNIVAFWKPKPVLPAKARDQLHLPPALDRSAADRLQAGAVLRDALRRRQRSGHPGVRARLCRRSAEIRCRPTRRRMSRSAPTRARSSTRRRSPRPNSAAGGCPSNSSPTAPTLVELRAQLMSGDTPLSEIWLYRWTP